MITKNGILIDWMISRAKANTASLNLFKVWHIKQGKSLTI